jgi:hypothetical protein
MKAQGPRKVHKLMLSLHNDRIGSSAKPIMGGLFIPLIAKTIKLITFSFASLHLQRNRLEMLCVYERVTAGMSTSNLLF